MPLSFEETIEFLYARLPMFTRDGPRAFKKNLDNTLALCDAFGNPQKKITAIHIAGTNGKGSTSNMLAAMLQQQGFKTGLYTSPHIKDFRERIRVNGKMVDKEFVIDFAEKSKPLIETIQPSFFELSVVMAYQYFAEQKTDIVVVETGLGGRLDSTNVIAPILSVITNIGYDHINILGSTLEKIAYQKAGIIKEKTPVVIGEFLPETKNIFLEEAKLKNAPIYFAQEMYESKVELINNKRIIKVKDKDNGIEESFELDLQGSYQENNLKTVLAAEKILSDLGFPISETNEKYALANVQQLTGLQGRWQIVAQDPIEIHDVGHNEDGIKSIINQLNQTYPNQKIHFVLGFVKDKDIDSVLDLFPKDAKYYFTNAHLPRALNCELLQELAAKKGLVGNAFDDVNEAISSARKNANKEDIIMVCGSFFILAEVN